MENLWMLAAVRLSFGAIEVASISSLRIPLVETQTSEMSQHRQLASYARLWPLWLLFIATEDFHPAPCAVSWHYMHRFPFLEFSPIVGIHRRWLCPVTSADDLDENLVGVELVLVKNVYLLSPRSLPPTSVHEFRFLEFSSSSAAEI
jgi:hypothetical protein